MNLIDLAQNFSTEESAIKFLEAKLWPDGPVCPHCGVIGEAFKMESRAATKNKMRPGLWKCSGCRKTFRVTVGTIFEDSHIPLHKWMMAIHLMSASKKGMSAHQLHRMLGLGYRAAWFMAHRIRYAMKPEAYTDKFKGTIEVDETYVGGKPRKRRFGPNIKRQKSPVVSLVERGGRVRSFQLDRVTSKNVKQAIRDNVKPWAYLNTDDRIFYKHMKKEFPEHRTINHSEGAYSRMEGERAIHTNTVEGYFSLIKRGIYGTFHHVSKQHLHRYLSEFDFRYNARETTDGERALLAINGVKGKRLMYRTRLDSQN